MRLVPGRRRGGLPISATCSMPSIPITYRAAEGGCSLSARHARPWKQPQDALHHEQMCNTCSDDVQLPKMEPSTIAPTFQGMLDRHFTGWGLCTHRVPGDVLAGLSGQAKEGVLPACDQIAHLRRGILLQATRPAMIQTTHAQSQLHPTFCR